MIAALIVSDNNKLKDNIESFIILKEDFYAFSSSCSFEEIQQSIEFLPPQFIIIDFLCNINERLELTRRLKNFCPEVRLIAVSKSVDRNRLFDALRYGIDAYLTKDGIFNELFRCFFALMQGERYLSVEVVNHFLDYIIETPHLDEQRPGLFTNREKEHIALIAEGLNPKEIAYKMKISKKTVDNYRNRIMLKLKINSIAEIVKYAIKEQIITL